MPTYEYRCPEGHDFERFLKMSEATDTMPCPVHGTVATRIISGGAGLLFKGSGFYITDYGKDGKKDQQKPAGDGASAEGKSEGKSSDGKAAEAKTSDAKPGAEKPAADKPAATTGSGKSGSGTTAE